MAELQFPKLNRMEISGRLTKDPEFKVVGENQVALAIISIAFDDGHMGSDGWIEKTGYVDVKTWSKGAEKAQDLHKGDPVIVEGKLGYESWQNKAGENRSKLIITAFKVYPLAKSKERIEVVETEQDNAVNDGFPF